MPVSSSQTVIGAIIGIAIVKGARNVKQGVLARIAGGWIVTPIMAGVLSFFGLFFLQNVFTLTVQEPVPYELTRPAVERLVSQGAPREALEPLVGQRFQNARAFKGAVRRIEGLDGAAIGLALEAAEIRSYEIDLSRMSRLDLKLFTPRQTDAIRLLSRRSYNHRWQLREALVEASEQWAFLPETRQNYVYNKNLETRLRYIEAAFRVQAAGPDR